ncbi:MAG: hypothetical protein M1822_007401 [Bathelium mastoideum]|nr:MAG: hypothetical protein M1822_007401 [Bathelium mastoideum]
METDMTILSSFLHRHPSIKFIRLQFADLSGILHTRLVTTQYCLDLVGKEQYATVGGRSMLHAVNDALSPIAPPIGLCELHPDWQSLRICTFASGHASVQCFVWDTYSEEPFHLCPRRKLVDKLIEWESKLNVTFLTGFEIEFVLLDSSGQIPQTVDGISAWSTTAGLRGSSLDLTEDIVEALEASDISVVLFHTSAPNQLQIATGPMSPVHAIDALMQTHECIKHIAVRYGLHATMAPKALPDSLATGAHVHISLQPPSKRESFLAGVLDSLPAIMALTMPSYDSYHRVTGVQCGAGTLVAWGTENRYVPIRAIRAGRLELRSLDATANFYLALLAILAAGMRGIEEGLPLEAADCQVNPFELQEEERRALGIVRRLPDNMKESNKILKESTVFDETLGTSLKRQYIAMKEVDEKDMSELSEHDRRAWFVKMY